jgi:hypothetical protein
MKSHKNSANDEKNGSKGNITGEVKRGDTVVAEWRVSKSELLRVIVRPYGGRLFIDVRRWFYDATPKLCPGKKGLSIRFDDLQPLRKALRKSPSLK